MITTCRPLELKHLLKVSLERFASFVSGCDDRTLGFIDLQIIFPRVTNLHHGIANSQNAEAALAFWHLSGKRANTTISNLALSRKHAKPLRVTLHQL